VGEENKSSPTRLDLKVFGQRMGSAFENALPNPLLESPMTSLIRRIPFLYFYELKKLLSYIDLYRCYEYLLIDHIHPHRS